MKKYLMIALTLILLSSFAILAGDNPFSGVVINNSRAKGYVKNSPDNYSQLAIKPIKKGQVEIGTVDVSSSLNIRTSPWGEVVGWFKKGDKVKIIGVSGDWYKISYKGKTAYVHSAYILRKGEKKKTFSRNGWVNAPLGLKVRRVPHGDVVAKLPDQKAVEILGVSGEYYKIKWGDNEAFVDRRYIDTANIPSAPAQTETQVAFTGRINCSALNVRLSPWGPIQTALPRGTSVKVVGKTGDWYKIKYGNHYRYVFAKYVSSGSSSNSKNNTVVAKTSAHSSLSGNEKQRIVKAAKNLVGSHAFRTKDVAYGRLACAKVVTTALKNAGALNRVYLNCRDTVKALKRKGWREVKVPPFEEGDVITWKTYDYTGDGVKDDDTHIGIMVKKGGTFKAMNNSSRLRMPRYSDPFRMTVSRVLRKVV